MKVILKIFLVASLFKFISCSGHFTVIGSKSVNENGKYNVAFTSRNFDDSDPPMLEVAIQSKDGGRMDTQNITLTNGKSQSLEFDIDGPIVGNYMNLSINCIRGLHCKQIVTLNLNTRNVTAFVQTDKAIYKPSDLVRFRVLVLDANLKPLNASNVRIFVIDSGHNKVKEFASPIFKKGVFEGRYKLSDSPVLGNWHIEVIIYSRIAERTSFEVTEYTLPTFEIILDVKPHVSFAEGRIVAFLLAKYTFGKAAKGNATIIAQTENINITKSAKFSGKTSVKFDIKNELGLKEKNANRIVKLFVTFIEEITGKAQNATATVKVHAVPYKLQMKTKSNEFKPGLPYTIEAMVHTHDANVRLTDNKNPVTFKVTFVQARTCHYRKLDGGSRERKSQISFEKFCSGGSSTVKESKGYPTDGTSKYDFSVPDDIVSLNVTVTYLNTELSRNKIRRASSEDDHFITITLKTKIPKLKENVKINIQSTKPFTEFSYHVLSIRGRLVASDTIRFNNSILNHDFEFTPASDMERKVKVIAFYVTDKGEFVSDSLYLEFDELKNFVDVQMSDEAVGPNKSTNITITSNPNSLVALMAIDASLSVLKSATDFSDKIKGKDRLDLFIIVYPGSKSFIPFAGHSDDNGPFYKEEETDNKKSQAIEYRKSFPESWLFESVSLDVDQTSVVLSKNVPDTITSWAITAFSIHPTTGLAIIRKPVTLRVFKPLFISMDLPYSIIRNEIVYISISVFNYMEADCEVNITLHNEDEEFTFYEMEGKKRVHVNKESGNSTSFKIRSNKIGSIKIRVSATSLSSQGDGIERYLIVKPEGATMYANKAVFVDLRSSTNYRTRLKISIPPAAVNGSIRIKASIIGDILGLSGSFRDLLRLPIGSSEQNMINFVPSIAVLDYLTAVNKLTPEVKNAAIENLELVYQKQLKYKNNNDGSFNVWGKRNESGSTWVTAFVVKSFGQAKKYIFVDATIIEEGLRFLSQTQLENGSFENRIDLTAYVLIAFLENADYVNAHNSTVDKALSFLGHHFKNITDHYSLAIATYALQLGHFGNETIRNGLLSKLENAAIQEGETMRWEGIVADKTDHDANSLDIETTAYALLAHVEAGRLHDAVRITKWLVSQRNENGGFISTQDTVVALQAMSKAAAKMYSSSTDMEVTVNSSVNESATFQVNSTNALILQTENLPPSATDLEITASGSGLSIFQITYQYNVEQLPDEVYKFNISRAIVSKTAKENIFFLETCVNYIPYQESSTSKTAILEVTFPTGFKCMDDYSKELKDSTDRIKRLDYRPTSVIVFFEHRRSESVCLWFHFYKIHNCENVPRGSINVYDYNYIKHWALEPFFVLEEI